MAKFTPKRPPAAPPIEGITIELNVTEANYFLDILEEYVELEGSYDITAPKWIDELREAGVEGAFYS